MSRIFHSSQRFITSSLEVRFPVLINILHFPFVPYSVHATCVKSCVLLLKVAVVGGMDRHRLRKASFLKCFLSRLKRKASGFKFLRFEERFQKTPLSSVDGRLKLGNTALFFNSLGLVWIDGA